MKKYTKFLSLILLISALAIFVQACKDDDKDDQATPAATCSDGIQNQGETGIDCGGPCTACAEDTSYTAKVDGVVWESDIQSVSNTPATKITLVGIESTSGTRITLTYSGPFTTGTVNIGSTFVAEYRNAQGDPFGGISGSITFTKFDTTNKVISGTFSCNVKNNNTNVTKVITNGVIQNIEY
jgi:hypothetical protein